MAALGFFDDHLVDLGGLSEGVDGTLDLTFLLERGPASTGSGFGLNFVLLNGTPVPEPGTGSLLGGGLLAVALLGRRAVEVPGHRASRAVAIIGSGGGCYARVCRLPDPLLLLVAGQVFAAA